jgi:hypothetical protein
MGTGMHCNRNNNNIDMNYRFEQFNVEIIDPTIEIVGVNDFINDKTCSVDVVLHTDTAKFGIKLTGFIYDQSWEDIDIINWVNTEIDKFLV